MERVETTTAPGLSWRPRKDGPVAYWLANPAAIRAGYTPKCVRLSGTIDELIARCHVLQAEMLEWLSGKRGSDPRTFKGTLASLVELYETDLNSPYRDMEPGTQGKYSRALAQLMTTVGTRKVSAVTGADTRRWYKAIVERSSEAYAHYVIAGSLKSALNYGVINRLEGCQDLRDAMRAIRFPRGETRRVLMTRTHWEMFCQTAHEMQMPSMALGWSLQFFLHFRARDVIGKWVRDDSGGSANDRRLQGQTVDEIRQGRWTWRDGLTTAHLGPDGVMRKRTSKTGSSVAHRVVHYPDLMRFLAGIPRSPDRPLVVCEQTRLPYRDRQYRSYFRKIAREAQIPDHIWLMDARGGGITDAFAQGAEVRDIQGSAGHSDAQTTWRYNKDTVALTDRVHKLRGGKYNPGA